MKKLLIPFAVSLMIILVSFVLFQSIELYFENCINAHKGQAGMYSLISFLILVSDILLPVPSSIVMFSNGYVLGMTFGFILSLLSVLPGACIGYLLGRYTSIGLRAREDANAAALMESYGSIAILVSRGIPILSESISVTLGFNKMPFGRFLWFNFAGYVPVCMIYAWFGSMGYSRNAFLLSFCCSILMAVFFWIAGRRMVRKAKYTYEHTG
jgi:uncharacterized membrane protein YdjX (TVP38/TMEM64 family)